jgi:hypothetical protein
MTEPLISQPTRSAFLGTRLLNVPFWVLFNLLPFILYKEMHIAPWMVTAMIVIKPASALFASYWSNWIHERPDRLVYNLLLANILRYLPFLLLPWITSAWVIIASYGLYMMLSRGVIPAWMEIFKTNFESKTRSKVFALGQGLDYLSSALLPIGIGLLLDDYTAAWRILIPLTAVLGLASSVFLLRLPQIPPLQRAQKTSLKEELFKPWKQAYHILKNRPDFATYQWGFMLGGAGLMVMQPIIPIFFVDVLNLSYTKMLLAMGACKALGYAAASPFWIPLFHRWNLYFFSGSVTLLAAAFPWLILLSPFHPWLIYLAYVLYGIMQAGSELSWHLSGPLFSGDKDSSPYSMTNVLTVGIRGCIAPPLGSLLFAATSSPVVLLTGSLLCLLSSLFLIGRKPREAAEPTETLTSA